MDKSAKLRELADKYQLSEGTLLDMVQEEVLRPVWLRNLVAVQAAKTLGRLEQATDLPLVYRLQGEVSGQRMLLNFIEELFTELESLKEATNA